jgi:hypothetical protein
MFWTAAWKIVSGSKRRKWSARSLARRAPTPATARPAPTGGSSGSVRSACWRDATDAKVKALLRELLTETPTTLAEWLRLGAMIRDVECDLRRAGKLPEIPNFGP